MAHSPFDRFDEFGRRLRAGAEPHKRYRRSANVEVRHGHEDPHHLGQGGDAEL